MDLLRQRAWRFICATFPERQLYIRSDGRVQFFTFSPLTQAVMVGVSLLFLCWVAFTSVNVIFKDRILTAKEHRFEQMQGSYESRIADLQLSYDELNGALVTAEDQFKTVADGFEAKQRILSELLEHKQNLRASLAPGRPNSAPVKSSAPAPASPSTPAITSILPAVPSLATPAGVGGAFEATAPDALKASACSRGNPRPIHRRKSRSPRRAPPVRITPRSSKARSSGSEVIFGERSDRARASIPS